MKHFDRTLTEALENLESGGVSAEKFINFISAIVSSAHQDKVPLALQKALSLPPQELVQIMNATTWVGHDQNLKNALAANPKTVQLVNQLADHVKEFAVGAAEAVGQHYVAPPIYGRDVVRKCSKCGNFLIDSFSDDKRYAIIGGNQVDLNGAIPYHEFIKNADASHWPLKVQLEMPVGTRWNNGGIGWICNGGCSCDKCDRDDCSGDCTDDDDGYFDDDGDEYINDDLEYDPDADYFSQGEDYDAH